MALRVYNTLTRQKEPFPKPPGEPVGLYVCGPTVYKPSHIGHMVGPVIFDAVKRYLTYLGYRVTWVVNITDVDDKLIARAKELGTTVKDAIRRNLARLLQVDAADVNVKAKTGERVGAIGRAEAIGCQAVALIGRPAGDTNQ